MKNFGSREDALDALRTERILSISAAPGWFAVHIIQDGDLLLPLSCWALVDGYGVTGMTAEDGFCDFAESCDSFDGYEFNPSLVGNRVFRPIGGAVATK